MLCHFGKFQGKADSRGFLNELEKSPVNEGGGERGKKRRRLLPQLASFCEYITSKRLGFVRVVVKGNVCSWALVVMG